MPLLASS
jgi:integrase